MQFFLSESLACKASEEERGREEGQNTWGLDWLGGPKILVNDRSEGGGGAVMGNHLLILSPPLIVRDFLPE